MSNLVSVIVPCYNQAQYLPEALDSVAAQTYPNWECIIVNDGSPDRSEEIASGYCSKDKRFKYLKKDNGGLSSARNAGLRKANGSWIQFLDADDYIAPSKMESSLGVLERNPSADLIVSDFKMFRDKPADATEAFCQLNQQNLNLESILLKWNTVFNIPIHCGLFRSTLFADNYFVESLKVSEDWVMWIKCFLKQPHAVYLNEALAYYRFNPNSMTKDKAFVRNNLIDTYQYIYGLLAPDAASRFAFEIFNRLNHNINYYEVEIDRLRNKSLYKAEEKIKKSLRRLLKGNEKDR